MYTNKQNGKRLVLVLLMLLISTALFAIKESHGFLLRYQTKVETYAAFYAYGSEGKNPIAGNFTVLEYNKRTGIGDFFVITNVPVKFLLTFTFSGYLSTKTHAHTIPYMLEYLEYNTGDIYHEIVNNVPVIIDLTKQVEQGQSFINTMSFGVRLGTNSQEKYIVQEKDMKFAGNYSDTITIEVKKDE